MKFIFLLLFPSLTWASFDKEYEYRFFSKQEMDIVKFFPNVDSEYASDTLTYSTPLRDEVRFQLSEGAILLSYGSLSRNRFMKDVRVKVKRDLSDTVAFKFNYLEQEDFENAQSHTVFEFVFKTSERLHFSLFADFDFYKENDTAGVTFSYFPVPNHEMKVFVTMVQFDRNKRNSDPDRFIKKPYAMGIRGKYFQEKNGFYKYFEYGILNELPTQWSLPTDNLLYSYERWMATVRYLDPFREDRTFAIFFQTDRRQDMQYDLTTRDPLRGLDLRRNQLQVNYNRTSFTKFEWDVGSYLVYRKFKDTAFYDAIPYTTVHFNKDLSRVGFWSLGYDMDIHREDVSGDAFTEVNHRGNIFWTARLRSHASLRFAATLDIDDISWEGGNGQFAMEF